MIYVGLYSIEFQMMPGVVFIVDVSEKRTLRDGQMLAEWMKNVAAEIWFGRSTEDRQRILGEMKLQ